MAGMAITVGGYFLGAVGGHVYMQVKGEDGGHAQAAMLLYADEDEKAHADGDAEHSHADGESHADHGDDHAHDTSDGSHGPDPSKFHQDIGTFFSIYYCMTGLHAIHIIAGIIFLRGCFGVPSWDTGEPITLDRLTTSDSIGTWST